jgi:hypothetical protein
VGERLVFRPVTRVAALGLVAVTVLVGCTSGDDGATESTTARSMPEGEERILPEGDEPEVLGPLGETEAEFETEDGLVQIGSAEVPEAVADSFPIPDDIEVQLSSQAGTEGGFSGVTDMTFDELVAFYESELPAAGYELDRSQFVDGVVAVYDFAGTDGTGQLAISSAPGGGHSVLVTFES